METKIKLLLCILLFKSIAYCQNDYTVLEESIYSTIKFHDVLLTDIKNTSGTNSGMATLFPIDQNNTQTGMTLQDPNGVVVETYGQEIGELHKEFLYNSGLKITFANDDDDQVLEVVDIVANIISINGQVLETGDSISNLTSINYTICNGIDNYKYVDIIKVGHDAAPITISLDDNNIITKIHYYVEP